MLQEMGRVTLASATQQLQYRIIQCCTIRFLGRREEREEEGGECIRVVVMDIKLAHWQRHKDEC